MRSILPIATLLCLAGAGVPGAGHAQQLPPPGMDVRAVFQALAVFTECKLTVYDVYTVDGDCIRPGETSRVSEGNIIQLKDHLGLSLVVTNKVEDARTFIAELIKYYTDPGAEPAKAPDYRAQAVEAIPGQPQSALVIGANMDRPPESTGPMPQNAYARAYLQCHLAMLSYDVRTTKRDAETARQIAHATVMKAAQALVAAKLCDEGGAGDPPGGYG